MRHGDKQRVVGAWALSLPSIARQPPYHLGSVSNEWDLDRCPMATAGCLFFVCANLKELPHEEDSAGDGRCNGMVGVQNSKELLKLNSEPRICPSAEPSSQPSVRTLMSVLQEQTFEEIVPQHLTRR